VVLADHITAHLNTPFAWGAHDCVGFAAAWLKNSTGIDHLAELSKWTTAAQAARIIKQEGGLEAALNARFERTHPNYAHDGDLALHNGCLCLFSGAHIVGPGKTGLTHNSRLLAEAAWRVFPLSSLEQGGVAQSAVVVGQFPLPSPCGQSILPPLPSPQGGGRWVPRRFAATHSHGEGEGAKP